MWMHQYFIQDGSILKAKDYQPNTGVEIYEVLRVMDGVPLFFEDHFSRFMHSAWLCHLEIPLDPEEIYSFLELLTEANGIKEGNIRFCYCFRPSGKFQAYFIPHQYPDRDTIEKGVICGLLTAERHDPNAKVIQHGLKEKAVLMMDEYGFYEVLLVNRSGFITEGSRSNVFFLKDGIFFTSPAEEVLPGITRQKVLEILPFQNERMVIRNLAVEELPEMDGAFLTGTSPKVLPIRQIDKFHYSVGHPEVSSLIKSYDKLVADYIHDKKLHRGAGGQWV